MPHSSDKRIPSQSSILRGAAKKVGEDDPIGDYKSMVESTEEDKFDLATSQLQNLIRAWLDRPSDDALIQRIQDSVGIMREKCGEACEEDNFNTFGEFGGLHRPSRHSS